MSNNAFFSECLTLADLQSEAIIGSLHSKRKELYNCKNAFSLVEDWLNRLIAEYNKTKDRASYKCTLFRTLGYMMPILSFHGTIFALVNRCILSDNDVQCERSIKEANYYFHFPTDSEIYESGQRKILNLPTIESYEHAYAYYVLGFMNFRLQDYFTAVEYLLACSKYLENGLSDINRKETYISCIIYLANCYEYTNRPEEALKTLLGVEKDTLSEQINLNQKCIIDIVTHLYNTKNKEITKNDVKNVCMLMVNEEPRTFAVFEFGLDPNNNTNKYLVEYIHILAHSLSEYSAKKIYDESSDIYPLVSLLQLLSRFLMDWIAREDDAYITCQATVRAENDACREALLLLMQHYKTEYPYPDELVNDEERAEKKAELEFYIFYFAEQELRYNYQDKFLEDEYLSVGKRFLEYAESTQNNDSEFYYRVIHFKYLLKKNAESALLNNPNPSNDFTAVDEAYIQLVDSRHKELKHVFKWLIDECERLERLYVLFRQFRYLNTTDYDCLNMSEYLRLLLRECVIISDCCAEELEKQYEEIARRNKILILAPVQTAPSCAFRGRSIDELLPIPENNSILENNSTLTPPKYLYDKFNSIEEKHEDERIETLQTINTENHSKKAKWAFVHRQNGHFLIHYKNENKEEQERSTFPAVLVTQNEQTRLSSLLNALTTTLKNQHIPRFSCRRQNHKNNCYTRVVKYGDNLDVDKALLDLLIFFEFDFCLENYNRLEKGDCILISHRRIPGYEYKIAGFSDDISQLKEENVCCFVNVINSNNVAIDSTPDSASSDSGVTTAKVPCEYIYSDKLKELKEKLNNNMGKIDSDSDMYHKYEAIEKMLESCTTITSGNCESLNEKLSSECKLKMALKDIGLSNYIRRFSE